MTSTSADGPIVSLVDATKDYALGSTVVHALRGATLEVPRGAFMSIVGPSGSGKTTLLNLIGCVDRPTSGRVTVDGRDTSKLRERELTRLRLHTIGFIFQSFNLVHVLDVFRNVELPLLLQGQLGARARRERTLALLDRVGLSDHIKHRPSELSGGQRQRVAIARALVTRPKLVLADEPTANLDSATGESILDLMKDLNRDDHTTFIFSTHDARVMAHASSRVYIEDGRVASIEESADGSPAVAAGRMPAPVTPSADPG
ncbi:MAG: ABC transporter ATP-binding protein [Myxococcales bacterium]|nr:ABC transporter ATP-binding protein [Myxococcales bacterium]